MKRLENLYKTKCVAQLYLNKPFTPRNKPFVPTDRKRIERYNTMAREQNPTLQGFQSYRQRTLLPVVAEGMARLPQNPRKSKQTKQTRRIILNNSNSNLSPPPMVVN